MQPATRLSFLASACRPRPPTIGPLPRTRPRHLTSSAAHRAAAAQRTHYEVLGVPPNASKKALKHSFYNLSKRYHPDTPPDPSSRTTTPEARTARFQSISESYAVLSHEASRRQYDQSLSSTSSGISAYGRRPTYASGAGHESGFSSRGGSGSAGAAAWSTTENAARRERANYAWGHPSRRHAAGAAAGAAGSAGESRRDSPTSGSGHRDPSSPSSSASRPTADEHYYRFVARDAKARVRAHAHQVRYGTARTASSGSGPGGYADNVEAEHRLINDSSVARSGQVVLVFAAAFVLAGLFSRGRHRDGDVGSRK